MEVKNLNVNSKCSGWPEFNRIYDTDEQCLFTQNSCNKQRHELKLDKELLKFEVRLECTWISL